MEFLGPRMPVSSLSGPVTGTGEIIVTGMIEVPRIVTSTGTVPSVHDSADVDDYVEPGDVELTSTGTAPVSALRAALLSCAARSRSRWSHCRIRYSHSRDGDDGAAGVALRLADAAPDVARAAHRQERYGCHLGRRRPQQGQGASRRRSSA